MKNRGMKMHSEVQITYDITLHVKLNQILWVKKNECVFKIILVSSESEASFSKKDRNSRAKNGIAMWKLYNQNTSVGNWTKLDSVLDLNFRLNTLEAVTEAPFIEIRESTL